MLATCIRARLSFPLLAEVNVQPRLLFLFNPEAGQLKISTLHSARNEPPIALHVFQRCISKVRDLEGEVRPNLPSLSFAFAPCRAKIEMVGR
jgi:hypothetical protein